MSAKYRIIITGLKPDGVGEHEARVNLAKLLKAPAEKIDRLLDSAPVVIKKNVERELGEKFLKVLSQAGALAKIEPEGLELSLEPTEEKPPEAAPQFTCPQCGVVVQKVGMCSACLENDISAGQQNAVADRSAKRRERKELVKESAIALFISWIRGNVWKAGIVIILVPVFGGNFLLSSVFYTKDRHIVYQTLTSRTVCLKNPTEIYSTSSAAERDLYVIFYDDFTVEEKKQLLEKWDNVACRATYEMELGNIGDEPVTTSIKFATRHLVRGSKSPDLIVYQYFRDLSAATPREKNPVVKQDSGVVTLENIYPNTLVQLKFGGWVDDKDSAEPWESVLADISVDEGVIEVGDPLATAFGRLLTVFF